MTFNEEQMRNLSRTANAVVAELRAYKDDLSAIDGKSSQLEGYRSAYSLVDSLVDDLGEILPEMPPDLLYLHREAERILRRYQIYHPSDEDELRASLAWMHLYGNAADLQVLKEIKGATVWLYPGSIQRIDETITEISFRARTEHKTIFSRFDRSQWVMVGVLCCVVSVLAGITMRDLITQTSIPVYLGLIGGIACALFLFYEVLGITKDALAQICLIAAGILMLIETAGLFHIGRLVK